jgi:hypothetical protein
MTFSKDDLNTGDILLFHHTNDYKSCYNCFFSCITGLIETCTESKFSHVALVIRDPQFTNPPRKGLFIMESSFESFPDAEDHKYKFGVELEEFDKVIDAAAPHDQIYWRKLKCNRDRNFFQLLKEAHEVVHNKPYDFYPPDFINALIHKKGGDTGQLTSRFFCSALVAYIYVQWGFLPYTTEWSRVTPKMFSYDIPESEPYKLVFKNCRVYPEIQI